MKKNDQSGKKEKVNSHITMMRNEEVTWRRWAKT